MRISKSSLSLWLCIAPVAALFALLVGFRGDDVGADTLQYKNIIDSFFELGSSRHELGFVLLLSFLGLFSERAEFIFFCIFIIIFLCMLKSFSNFLEEGCDKSFSFFIFLGCLLLSDWFFVATTNGLRQGLSLAVLYLAASYWPKSRMTACLLACMACLFHYATILIVVFFPLILLGVTTLFVVFLFIMLLYACGINELLFKFLCDLFNVGIYDRIESYGGDSARWVGFQILFVAYTIFWGVFFYFSSLVREERGSRVTLACKTYFILSMPLFVYGFGGYSNRYGFMAWLFLPICQALSLASAGMLSGLRGYLAFSLLFLGVIAFSIKLYG